MLISVVTGAFSLTEISFGAIGAFDLATSASNVDACAGVYCSINEIPRKSRLALIMLEVRMSAIILLIILFILSRLFMLS